jgi:hypothetical protein
MSYFSGISMDKVPIAESFKAVMGNFLLVITNNASILHNAKKNYLEIKDKFDKNYMLTPKTREMLKNCIVSGNSIPVDEQPVDYAQLTKFIRYDLDVDTIKRAMDKIYTYNTTERKLKKKAIPFDDVFAILLKSMTFLQIPVVDRLSKFQLPIFIDGRFFCVISFDEKDIHKVLVLTSRNMYDINEALHINCRLDTDKNFDKTLFFNK